MKYIDDCIDMLKIELKSCEERKDWENMTLFQNAYMALYKLKYGIK